MGTNSVFDTNSILLGITWYVVFLLSTTCHEAAHALAAKIGVQALGQAYDSHF